jgi:hypothetical protein
MRSIVFIINSKLDNQWYRDEIENSQRDTIEYVNYLESKKDEKLNVINNLTNTNLEDLEKFKLKRGLVEVENTKKLDAMGETIGDLEDQLKIKENEFLHLSDTLVYFVLIRKNERLTMRD